MPKGNGSVSMKNKTKQATETQSIDYQKHMRQVPPGASSLTKGPEARRARLKSNAQTKAGTKERINIRLDEDVISAFKELAADGGYQTLINQALRDWLAVRSVAELMRQELPALVGEAMTKIQHPDNQSSS